ncbi:MAG: cytochrome P450 [Pseudomonadota bacterium]
MTAPEISLRDPAFDADKYGEIERLRTQSYYARIEGGVVFFNQEDCFHVLRCRDFRFSFFQIAEARSPYLAEAIKHELLNMHGGPHERLQKLVLAALRDKIVDELRARITAIVDDLIDEMGTGDVDFCAAFADPLPARILGPMFDIPYEDTAGLNDWIKVGGRKVDALQSGVGLEEVETANRNMHDYFRGQVRARRGRGGEDVFSQLMTAEIDGDRLSEDELVYLTSELGSAGVDTTRSQLPLILHTLLTHPTELGKLRSDPSLARAAVDEGMRFAPLPWCLPHAALSDHTYKDIEFREGDLAMTMVPAANRDPAAMEAPQTFDITRKRVRNFSFGYGMHACPGAQLARLEMAIALERLTARLSMELVGEPPREPVQKGSTPKELRIRIAPRA